MNGWEFEKMQEKYMKYKKDDKTRCWVVSDRRNKIENGNVVEYIYPFLIIRKVPLAKTKDDIEAFLIEKCGFQLLLGSVIWKHMVIEKEEVFDNSLMFKCINEIAGKDWD